MQRLTAIDSARGLAMIFMLVNHASWRIPEIELGANYGWIIGDPVAAANGIGWLNLFQGTPIFMLLTGFGVALFEHSRQGRGWTEQQITRYFFIRGGVLILLDLFIVPWVIHLPSFQWESKFFILTCIGICLWALAILRRVPGRTLLMLAVVLTIGCQIIYHLAAPGDSNLLRSLMFYPSPFDPVRIGYPVFAWLPVIILGYSSAWYLIHNPERFTQHCAVIGSVGLTLWAAVTIGDGFGKLYHDHPLLMGKHPPSLAYLSFNVGMAYLILAGIHKLPEIKLLAMLGQCSLIFYVVHWYVLMAVTGLLSVAADGITLYLGTCLFALAVLYPLCIHYRLYRSAHPRILQYL